MDTMNRRSFLGSGLLAAPAVLAGSVEATTAEAVAAPAPEAKYRLGMVTYNMGKDMTLDELLAFCKKTGLQGVELRTTHKHGVEVALSAAERAAVKAKVADAGIALAGLGSAFEFHSKDAAEVRENVEGAKAYAQLAADVGAPGIKLRPNGIFADEPVEQTCERIGKAWAEVAAFAEGLGVQTRMEVHGKGSSEPKNIKKMLDFAGHANCRVCWNSNPGDQDAQGSIRESFDLLKDRISEVHINDIGVYQYPWQELFDGLSAIGYTGFCLAEIAYNPEPERFMKYYKTLFDLYTRRYRYPR